MWSGPMPQQPPMMEAPAARQASAASQYSVGPRSARKSLRMLLAPEADEQEDSDSDSASTNAGVTPTCGAAGAPTCGVSSKAAVEVVVGTDEAPAEPSELCACVARCGCCGLGGGSGGARAVGIGSKLHPERSTAAAATASRHRPSQLSECRQARVRIQRGACLRVTRRGRTVEELGFDASRAAPREAPAESAPAQRS